MIVVSPPIETPPAWFSAMVQSVIVEVPPRREMAKPPVLPLMIQSRIVASQFMLTLMPAPPSPELSAMTQSVMTGSVNWNVPIPPPLSSAWFDKIRQPLIIAEQPDAMNTPPPVPRAAMFPEIRQSVMTGMVRDMTVEAAAMRAAAETGFLTATDLADWLVREAGLPFREAHHVTARLVALAEAKGAALAELELDEMRAVEPRIDAGVTAVLDVDSAVASRRSLGGTAPANVRRAVAAARERFL